MAPTITPLDDDDRKKLPEKPNTPKWVEGPANAIFADCGGVSYGKKGDDLERDPSKWTSVPNSSGKATIEAGSVWWFAGEHGKVYLGI